MRRSDCLVIGIGNPDRGDDAVGRIVARRLATQRTPGMQVMEHSGEAAGLLDYLAEAQTAYLIDASNTGARPGTISRFDAAARQLPRMAFGCSTHGMGLAEAIELARALRRLPRRCVVYAIEGQRYEPGAALSPQVAAAAEGVAQMIRNEMIPVRVHARSITDKRPASPS